MRAELIWFPILCLDCIMEASAAGILSPIQSCRPLLAADLQPASNKEVTDHFGGGQVPVEPLVCRSKCLTIRLCEKHRRRPNFQTRMRGPDTRNNGGKCPKMRTYPCALNFKRQLNCIRMPGSNPIMKS